MNRTRIEAAETIERFVSGGAGDYDWDDFTSISSHDPLVEKIRVECLEARDRFPPTDPKAYCSAEGFEYLLSLAAQLRARSMEPKYPRRKRTHLLRRFPFTSYTTIGVILSVWTIIIEADYDGGGGESLLFWSAQLFSLIPWFIQESFFTFREWFGWNLTSWRISLVLGLVASLTIDVLGRAMLIRVGLVSKSSPARDDSIKTP